MNSDVFAIKSDSDGRSPAVWINVSAWLLLLPLLYNCVKGNVDFLSGGDIRYRMTAMQGDSTMHRLQILLFVLTMAWVAMRHAGRLRGILRENRLLISLPILAILSSLWSGTRAHALLGAFSLLMQAILACYMCVFLRGKRLMEMIVFTGFIILTLSVLALFIHGVGIDTYQQNAWRGVFGQRNICGAACVWFLLSAAHYRPTQFIAKAMKLSVYLLGSVFLVMAGSRTAWELSCVAILICCIATAYRRFSRLDAIFIVCISVAAVACTSVLVYIFSAQILHAIGKDPTLTGRSILWAVALQSVAHHPLLGYGYASFWTGLSGESANAVLTTGWMEGQAQNGYIDLLLQLGLCGLAIFVVITVVALRQSIRTLRDPGVDFLQARWAFTLIILILLYNIGESAIVTAFDITWLLYLIALIKSNVPASSPSLAKSAVPMHAGPVVRPRYQFNFSRD